MFSNSREIARVFLSLDAENSRADQRMLTVRFKESG